MVEAAERGAAPIAEREEMSRAVVTRIQALCERGSWIPFASTEHRFHNRFVYVNPDDPDGSRYVIDITVEAGTGAIGCAVIGAFAGGAAGACKGGAATACAGPFAIKFAIAGFCIGFAGGAVHGHRKWHNDVELSENFRAWKNDLRHNGVWRGLLNYLAEEDPVGRQYRCSCGGGHSLWEPDERGDISVVEMGAGSYYLDNDGCRGPLAGESLFRDPRWKVAAHGRAKVVLGAIGRTGHLGNAHPQYGAWVNRMHLCIHNGDEGDDPHAGILGTASLEALKGEARGAVAEAVGETRCPTRFRTQISKAGKGEHVVFASVVRETIRAREMNR